MPDKARQPTAQVAWTDDGLPVATAYDDMYFSILNGLEESRYVFLEHNQLPQRWQQLASDEAFTLVETGFGTGLNFLATWQTWQASAPAGARLHYISIEKHPLKHSDLHQALTLWPDLTPLSSKLLQHYPSVTQGFQRLHLDDNVVLTLLFDDASNALSQLSASVDAWYLDGFAPPKNPDMWTDELFSHMAQLSHANTTFSTYTAASLVRRGLEAAGFSTERAKGFGRKREMLKGRLAKTSEPEITQTAQATPQIWFSPPKTNSPLQTQNTSDADKRKAVVIGAGLAGCNSAYALAKRGWQVTVVDRHPQAAQGASGNPQGVLYAKLPAVPTIASRIHLTGYLYSLQLLQQLSADPAFSPSYANCGVLQLALNASEQTKLSKLIDAAHYPAELVHAVTTAQASELAGVDISSPGLFFPEAGWVDPRAFCQKLLQHPNISCQFDTAIAALNFDPEIRQWQLSTESGTLQTPTLIIAAAEQTLGLEPLNDLPLTSIRGQLSQFPLSTHQQASLAATLKTVVCGNGYIAPAYEGWSNFGATFDLHSKDQHVRADDHILNLNHIDEILPTLAAELADTPAGKRQGRVGFRCAAPDYLPLVGGMPDSAAFAEDYAELSNNAKLNSSRYPRHLPGLYVNVAHGSKGLITAPLAAELLASLITNEPLPLERPLINALNPARFLIKDLIRRAI